MCCWITIPLPPKSIMASTLFEITDLELVSVKDTQEIQKTQWKYSEMQSGQFR